jgi:sporulation protein YlmC with PRC-barrel domain
VKRSSNRLRGYDVVGSSEGLGRLEQVLFSPQTGACKFLQFSSSGFLPFSTLDSIDDDSKTIALKDHGAIGGSQSRSDADPDPRLVGTRDLLEYAVVEDRVHLGFVSDFVLDPNSASVEHIIVYFLHGVREQVVDMKRIIEIDHTHSVLFMDGD